MTTDVHSVSLKYKDGGLKSGIGDLTSFAKAGTQAGSAASVFTGKIGLMNTTLKQTGTVALPKAQGSLAKFTSSLKPAKNATQLVAFQVQDLAVQLSMGTSALVAFGQQAPQIASAFGPGGAMLGAIVGVGLAVAGPLVAAFASGEDAVDQFQESIDSVRASLKSTRLEVNQGAIDLLKNQIRESTDQIERLQNIPDKIGGRAVTGLQRIRKQQENQEIIAELEKDRIKNAEILAELYRQQNEIQQEGVAITEEASNLSVDPEGERLRHLMELNKQDIADKRRTEAEKTRITQAEARQREAIERATRDTALTIQDQLTQIAAAGGEESFLAYKRLAQSQAAVSAALAVLNVLGDPLIPTALKIPAVATTTALAGVQIAQIESQTYSAARENGGQVQAGTRVLVGERGPEVLEIGAQGGFVTPNHKLSGGESVTIVNQIGNNASPNVRAEVAAMGPQITAMVMQGLKGARR